MKTYKVNEIFYSVQGEGARTGSANVFVRFSDCNLRCVADGEAGFDCDTEFISGEEIPLDDLLQKIHEVGGQCRSVIFTGGEPALRVDADLIEKLHASFYYLAIETNGTLSLPAGLDWICVSPKTALQMKILHLQSLQTIP